MSLQGSKLFSMLQHPSVMEEQVIASLSTTLLRKELSVFVEQICPFIHFFSDHESFISV